MIIDFPSLIITNGMVMLIILFFYLRNQKSSESSSSGFWMNLLSDQRSCPLPHYILISCLLSFLPLVTFLRLPVLLKASLLLPMASLFLVVIEYTHRSLFSCYDTRVGSVSSSSSPFIFITVFRIRITLIYLC